MSFHHSATRWLVFIGLFILGSSLAAWLVWSIPTTSKNTSQGDQPLFLEVTEELGLCFHQDPGPTGDFFMPQIMGTGIAVLDADGDGRLDLYLLNGGGPRGRPNQLFLQQADGSFRNASGGSGLDVAGFNTGVAVGDVDNDGLPDVLLVQYGGIRLFHNQGKGQFKDITFSSGLVNLGWGTSASFFDFDRDGWLDLVVANYVQYDAGTPCFGNRGQRDYCHPSQFPGQSASVYRNLGSQSDGTVQFLDVSQDSGVGKKPGPGLGVVCADFDGDGWPDILIANDGRPNHLWINRKNGTFQEEGLQRGLAMDGLGRMPANMGVSIGDVNGDGLFDVFISHLTDETHTIWRQGPRGLFRDRTASSGLATTAYRGTGFGTVLGDFDHDGHLDAVVVNGRVALSAGDKVQASADFFAPYRERNQCFRNDGTGRFVDVSQHNPDICGCTGVFRGLAVADLHNTGSLFLITTEVDGPARIFRASPQGNWLVLQVIDRACRRDAYGAEIIIVSGERRWWRQIQAGSSYLSSQDPRAHFGLGECTRIERILVRWPDGQNEVFPGGSVNQHRILRKGEGKRE